MKTDPLRWILILLVFGLALWLALPNSGLHFSLGSRRIDWDVKVHEGLDLQGGLQVLLEADLPADTPVSTDNLRAARTIVERRVNGLGVTEPLVQEQGQRRISVELPGIEKPEQAVALLKETGLLEFVDVGRQPVTAGTLIRTTGSTALPSNVEALAAESKAGKQVKQEDVIYPTIMSGADLESANVTRNSNTGEYVISFTLNEKGTQIFGDHTTKSTGAYLAIVLDGAVISSPTIREPITSGTGQISGQFTADSANQLALQLRYGALPVPLKVVNTRTIGPTLGQDSVRLSQNAGLIGFFTVALFMILYYRLPGLVAVMALAMYSAITFALFKIIPVTLTLPGIAGFVLSVGVAVDANILIFERMKEELRGGRRLAKALDEGFGRAWPSIRDSNISSLITCAILYWFGSSFGASLVQGFALTLALGIAVSLFTALVATRTMLHTVLDWVDAEKRPSWLGL
ncbi:MAG: protein translocase subunit SecD [Chloroflexi bacterium]|jgi:preprotein translocase subunit SecD|nr:MAG: protein translocase subunit SecD [Chloroflexota bacterium]